MKGRSLGPDRYLEVKYEALVEDPESILKSVTDFLGEDFHADMLNFADRARVATLHDHHLQLRGQLSLDPNVAWGRVGSALERRSAERVCAAINQMLGYEMPQTARAYIFLAPAFRLIGVLRHPRRYASALVRRAGIRRLRRRLNRLAA